MTNLGMFRALVAHEKKQDTDALGILAQVLWRLRGKEPTRRLRDALRAPDPQDTRQTRIAREVVASVAGSTQALRSAFRSFPAQDEISIHRLCAVCAHFLLGTDDTRWLREYNHLYGFHRECIYRWWSVSRKRTNPTTGRVHGCNAVRCGCFV
jgi:hypothetical protein